ncbi:MAG: hypothetical protein DRI36_00060 [Caldiserica bacterium]|nr:MAG: hypothetical protein DRI36_00060 [Caldisericota bacterium]
MRYLVYCVLIFLVSSCSKKNKLLENTLEIIISPSSVSISTGTSIELTATGKSAKSDNVDIDPVWSVTNNLGTFTPDKGKKVIFTAGNSAGSGVIRATEEDVYSEIPLTVKAGTGGGGTGGGSVVFYSDSGLNSDFGTPDIFTWAENNDISAQEITDGNGPSGDSSSYQSFSSNSSTWFGGGIVLNKVSGNASAVDLSAYSSGNSLKFYIKLTRQLSGSEQIKVEIEYGSGSKSTLYLSSSYGFDSTSTNWQEITIPLTDFTGVDFSSIKLPFEITAENITSSLTFYWDYVRWE